MSNNNIRDTRINVMNTGARNHLAVAAYMRSGAGSHKSGPRGGDRNEFRDMLDEYYTEKDCHSPDTDVS